MVPSPDGTVLALLMGEQDCEMRIATLTFLDPESLNTIDGPFIMEHIDTSEGFGPMVDFGYNP